MRRDWVEREREGANAIHMCVFTLVSLTQIDRYQAGRLADAQAKRTLAALLHLP